MMIRQMLGTAALFTMLGMEPPVVEAATPAGPFRFAVVTPSDNPQYIKVVQPRKRHYRRVVVRRRSKKKSAAIVAGSAATGAAIGALAGGGKGAAIGAIAGGGAGFVYDRSTHKKVVTRVY
jgi:uncharacterized protein YcfJ